jgi:hypothetical protein
VGVAPVTGGFGVLASVLPPGQIARSVVLKHNIATIVANSRDRIPKHGQKSGYRNNLFTFVRAFIESHAAVSSRLTTFPV